MAYNSTNEPNVEITYKCGHKWKTHSPGVSDPAGLWAEQPKSPDGIIRVEDFIARCFECRGTDRY